MVSTSGDLGPTAVDGRKFPDALYPTGHIRAAYRLSPATVGGLAAAADFAVLLATAAALAGGARKFAPESAPSDWFLAAPLGAILFVAGFERIGGYKLANLCLPQWQFTSLLAVWAVAAAGPLLIAFADRPSGRVAAVAWVVAVPVVLIAKNYLFQIAIAAWNRRGYLTRNVVIIGAGDESHRLITKLQAFGDSTIAVRGVFDDGYDGAAPKSVCGVSLLGTTDDLMPLVRTMPIDSVIVAVPLDDETRIKHECDKLQALAVDVRLSIEPLAELFQARRTSLVGNVPALELLNRPLSDWRGVIKNAQDKALAAVLLVALGPLLAILSLLIKLDSRGPALFVQERYGFNNEVIRVLKFRTMRADLGDRSGAQRTMQDDPRVTRLGRILRRLSLDELPQLINVLRGDMSFVGPRPHAVEMKVADRLYGDAVDQYRCRHRVKPGMTGLAQVNGLRGEVDTLEKGRARLALDLYYIEHWSLSLDLKILLKTVRVVLGGAGAW